MFWVTSGATEGVFAAVLGLTDPGDEVIVFEPVYDTYVPNLVMAGVTPRYVPLRGENWTFDPDELAKAFNSHTRAIIVNTPHNPTGKVYSRAELGVIADLCLKHDVIAITDEVYEHILYDDAVHTRLATLPGMEDRTVTISSLGKTFSVTGWKIGWAVGSAALVNSVNQAHQFITYAVASPLQRPPPLRSVYRLNFSTICGRLIKRGETRCSMRFKARVSKFFTRIQYEVLSHLFVRVEVN